jgi:hypothetical protein
MADRIDKLADKITPQGVQPGLPDYTYRHVKALRYLQEKLDENKGPAFSPHEKGLIYRAWQIAKHYDPSLPDMDMPDGGFVDEERAPEWGKKPTWLRDWEASGKGGK